MNITSVQQIQALENIFAPGNLIKLGNPSCKLAAVCIQLWVEYFNGPVSAEYIVNKLNDCNI